MRSYPKLFSGEKAMNYNQLAQHSTAQHSTVDYRFFRYTFNTS